MIVPLMVLALASVFFVESYLSTSKALFGWGPMVFPRWICCGGLLIALVNLRRSVGVINLKKGGTEPGFSGSQCLFLSVLAVSILLLPVVGYGPALAGFMFVSSAIMGVRGWKLAGAAVWSLVLSGASWWLFSDVLKVFLP